MPLSRACVYGLQLHTQDSRHKVEPIEMLARELSGTVAISITTIPLCEGALLEAKETNSL